jgi:hypothetical protein
MPWNLWTQDEKVTPPIEASMPYETKEAALSAACVALKTQRLKVLYIEGPDGERMEEEEIRTWCRENAPE